MDVEICAKCKACNGIVDVYIHPRASLKYAELTVLWIDTGPV